MTRKQMIKFLDIELDNYLNLDAGYEEGKNGGKLLLCKLESLDYKNDLFVHVQIFQAGDMIADYRAPKTGLVEAIKARFEDVKGDWTYEDDAHNSFIMTKGDIGAFIQVDEKKRLYEELMGDQS